MKKCFKFAKENSSSLGIVYRPIVKVGTRVAFAISEVPNLLGRLDVFDVFEICFTKGEDFCFSDQDCFGDFFQFLSSPGHLHGPDP